MFLYLLIFELFLDHFLNYYEFVNRVSDSLRGGVLEKQLLHTVVQQRVQVGPPSR